MRVLKASGRPVGAVSLPPCAKLSVGVERIQIGVSLLVKEIRQGDLIKVTMTHALLVQSHPQQKRNVGTMQLARELDVSQIEFDQSE